MSKSALRITLAGAAFAIVLGGGGDSLDLLTEGSLVKPAEAVIGRPWTPGSVAGVARRTTRRTIRRSAIYASTLPHGCVTVIINGVTTWRCGATYYQAYGSRYVVVYVY